jgi:hypothetical protein
VGHDFPPEDISVKLVQHAGLAESITVDNELGPTIPPGPAPYQFVLQPPSGGWADAPMPSSPSPPSGAPAVPTTDAPEAERAGIAVGAMLIAAVVLGGVYYVVRKK